MKTRKEIQEIYEARRNAERLELVSVGFGRCDWCKLENMLSKKYLGHGGEWFFCPDCNGEALSYFSNYERMKQEVETKKLEAEEAIQSGFSFG